MSQERPDQDDPGLPADEDLSRFCCQNPECPDYGQRAHGNLTVPMRYGPQKRRLLRCRTCKARFSERKVTALLDTPFAEEKADRLLEPLAEAVVVRKCSRLVGVTCTTVIRYSLLAGSNAQQLHDELVDFPPSCR